MKRNLLILFAIALTIASGVFVVTAQSDEGDATTPPFGPGWMYQNTDAQWGPGMMYQNGDAQWGPGMMRGRGGMGMYNMHGGNFGYGMMGAQFDHPGMEAMATALGMDVDALYSALSEGQSLSDIAEAQGVELATLQQVMVAQAAGHMAQLVADGFITQEQADARVAWMSENVDSMPMFSADGTGFGFGGCMGGFDSAAGFGLMGMRGGGIWR